MSPDIEDLLRSELRGAASGAPQHLGVDDQDVLARGHRVVVRRRIMTVAGVAAATLAIAGTIGVLAPRVNNDALPALPTPTVTPTPEVTPTRTSTASASATVTASTTSSPTATSTSTPSATSSSTERPSRTTSPSSAPPKSSTPSPSPSTSAEGEWSAPVTVAGTTYRGMVRPGPDDNYDLALEGDSREVASFRGIYGTEARTVFAPGDSRIVYFLFSQPIVDLVSIHGTPVSGEQLGTVRARARGVDADGNPNRDSMLTILRLSDPAPDYEMGYVGPVGWTVEFADGQTLTFEKG